MLDEPGDGLRRQHGAGGTAVDADRRGIVVVEGGQVDGRHILDAGGMPELRRHAVVRADDPVTPPVRDLHRFGMAEVACADGEASAVNADQQPVGVLFRDAPFGHEDLRVDPGHGLGGDLDGVLGEGVPVDRGAVIAFGNALAGRARGLGVAAELGASARERAELGAVRLAEVLHRRTRLAPEVGRFGQVEGRHVNGSVRLDPRAFLFRADRCREGQDAEDRHAPRRDS